MATEVGIIVGFDRSGTSAVSKTVARHPEVELLWRVFNSGSIRRKMNVMLNDETAEPEDKAFFSQLSQGVLDTSYIKTEYHWIESTAQEELVQDHLHVIITNINHFAVRWAAKHSPNILHWGLWRDPYQILQSCVENDFLNTWYEGVIPELQEVVAGDEILSKDLLWSHSELSTIVRKTAYILAVKNLSLFSAIPNDRVINYELFCEDANAALEPMLKHYDKQLGFDFSPALEQDLNTIKGAVPYLKGRVKKLNFDPCDFDFLERLFAPLYAAAGMQPTTLKAQD